MYYVLYTYIFGQNEIFSFEHCQISIVVGESDAVRDVEMKREEKTAYPREKK